MELADPRPTLQFAQPKRFSFDPEPDPYELAYRIVEWNIDRLESDLMTLLHGRPVAAYRRAP